MIDGTPISGIHVNLTMTKIITKTVQFQLPDGRTVILDNVRVEFRTPTKYLPPGQTQKYHPKPKEMRQMMERVIDGLDPGVLVLYPV